MFRTVHPIVLLINAVISLDFALNALLDLLLSTNPTHVCFVMLQIVSLAQLRISVKNVLAFSMSRMVPASAPLIPS